MRKILLVSFFAVVFFNTWAQERTVSGKVTSEEDGSALPGVNVLLKGTGTGTVTDVSGSYTLSVPASGGTLVFSFIGLRTQEVEVGQRSVVDVPMAQDVTQLTEVVVTALGTKQNAREVTYANQTVTSDNLLTSPNKNALEALRGKAAGVKITTSSGSVGASSRIVLRGEASLTGDNNALIVVDGIPINNTSSIGGAQDNESGYADYGNRFNDFDPNTIESVTVLTGPSATSLYGSRAASGVLLITTKKGKKGKLQVNLNSTASFEDAYVLFRRQNQFGQGLLNPDGSTNRDSGENFSWGPAFDGVVRPWTSPVDVDGDGDLEFLSRPYSAIDNQLEKFFTTGSTFNNTLSLSGGSEGFTYYASYSNTSQKGILDNTDYKRNNFTLNSTAKLNDKLNVTFGVTYATVDQNTAQEGGRAFEGQNPYASALQAPIDKPYTELRNYKSPYHGFTGYYGTYTINPYFILNEYLNNAKTNNMLANMSINYEPIQDLVFNVRAGVNYVGVDATSAVPVYAYTDHYIWEDNLALVERTDRQSSLGSYTELFDNSRNLDVTSTASYSKKLNDRLKLGGTVGFNIFDINSREMTGSTRGGFVVPDVYNLGNSKELATVKQNHFRRRIMGLFGKLTLGWDDKLFIDYSARNDWSSTLPVENQSFFYQSLGASAIISDFLGLEDTTPIDYLKVRASYGTTGKDASVHQLSNLYTVNPILVDYDGADENVWQINSPLNGQTTITRNSLIGNSGLKPELTTTFEAGLDLTLFDGRIEFNYTYYKANSTEQIVTVELPRSSGYWTTPVNIGEIQNQGHQIGLTLVPVHLQNGFKWTANLTWAKNINKVIKVSDQTDDLTIYDTGRGVTLRAEKGQPFGTWKGQVQRFTPDGRPIVDANGSRTYSSDIQTVANVQPDWIAGLVNTFSYKGFSLGMVIDGRKGTSFYSTTKFYTEFNGTALTTTIGDRKPFIIPNSVVENLDVEGNPDGTYSPNTVATIANSYLDDGNSTKHIIDGSFVKLREITLGYNLPKNLVNKLKLQNVSVRLFAKNLKFWLPEENSFADPEVNGPEGTGKNSVGLESSQTPPSRSYGINLNITL